MWLKFLKSAYKSCKWNVTDRKENHKMLRQNRTETHITCNCCHQPTPGHPWNIHTPTSAINYTLYWILLLLYKGLTSQLRHHGSFWRQRILVKHLLLTWLLQSEINGLPLEITLPPKIWHFQSAIWKLPFCTVHSHFTISLPAGCQCLCFSLTVDIMQVCMFASQK